MGDLGTYLSTVSAASMVVAVLTLMVMALYLTGKDK